MEKKEQILKGIQCMQDELGLLLDKMEQEAILETCEEWEMRAERLHKKMSKEPFVALVPANVFRHE